MTRYIGLLIAAYGLIAVETSLQTETGLVTPFGSFVWMLLPWLATHPSRSASILAAAFYGLMIDSVTNYHPGLMIAAVLLTTCILQKIVTQTSLETGPRVFFVSFACACLMAMLVATCSMIAGSSPGKPIELLSTIVFSSAVAAMSAASFVVVLRLPARTLWRNENLAN